MALLSLIGVWGVPSQLLINSVVERRNAPIEVIKNGPKRTLVGIAAKGCYEPDSAIMILCCVRSQRGKCGMSEKPHAVARREKPPFEDAAAWFWIRKCRSRNIDAVPDLYPKARFDC